MPILKEKFPENFYFHFLYNISWYIYWNVILYLLNIKINNLTFCGCLCFNFVVIYFYLTKILVPQVLGSEGKQTKTWFFTTEFEMHCPGKGINFSWPLFLSIVLYLKIISLQYIYYAQFIFLVNFQIFILKNLNINDDININHLNQNCLIESLPRLYFQKEKQLLHLTNEINRLLWIIDRAPITKKVIFWI